MIARKQPKSFQQYVMQYFWITVGAFLAALSIQVFLYPNMLIDGGVIGISLILARLFDPALLPIYLLVLNLPFIFLAYKFIRKSFVVQMLIAVLLFAGFLSILSYAPAFEADILEAIVIGGAILGAGAGLIIRYGGCTDGTEILGIIFNRKFGFTVGQVVFVVNIFVFGAYGWIFHDWHIALRSLMTYLVAFKMIDIVIAGLEEMKSVLILTQKPTELRRVILHEMGFGLTVIKGQGGFTGEKRDILFIIVERLDLAALKELVLQQDPQAFMAIETLHEVAYGKQVKGFKSRRKKSRKALK